MTTMLLVVLFLGVLAGVGLRRNRLVFLTVAFNTPCDRHNATNGAKRARDSPNAFRSILKTSRPRTGKNRARDRPS